jgi:hypothetical protein
MINLLKPACYFTYRQVLHSIILHADYIAFMFFCVALRRKVLFALYIISRLVFINEGESVYCAVRTEYLYETDKFRP